MIIDLSPDSGISVSKWLVIFIRLIIDAKAINVCKYCQAQSVILENTFTRLTHPVCLRIRREENTDGIGRKNISQSTLQQVATDHATT
jgi:hypothetical protein